MGAANSFCGLQCNWKPDRLRAKCYSETAGNVSASGPEKFFEVSTLVRRRASGVSSALASVRGESTGKTVGEFGGGRDSRGCRSNSCIDAGRQSSVFSALGYALSRATYRLHVACSRLNSHFSVKRPSIVPAGGYSVAAGHEALVRDRSVPVALCYGCSI
jgi:hypothetical protein